MEKTEKAALAKKVMKSLSERYPQPKTALHYRNPFELLIATMLSAQSTDRQVNRVTKELFKKYRNPIDFALLDEKTLANEIKGVGLYNTKSKNIIAACKILVDKYNSRVPCNLEALLLLPGVGRKTANVVLSNVFGIPAFAVDTHVFRVARRLGLADGMNAENVEKELMEIIPQESWSDAHHWLIFHGKETCKARNPLCSQCPFQGECSYVSNRKYGEKSTKK